MALLLPAYSEKIRRRRLAKLTVHVQFSTNFNLHIHSIHPRPQSKFFQFHTVFGKKLSNIRLAHPPWGWRPSLGNPGSGTAQVMVIEIHVWLQINLFARIHFFLKNLKNVTEVYSVLTFVYRRDSTAVYWLLGRKHLNLDLKSQPEMMHNGQLWRLLMSKEITKVFK